MREKNIYPWRGQFIPPFIADPLPFLRLIWSSLKKGVEEEKSHSTTFAPLVIWAQPIVHLDQGRLQNCNAQVNLSLERTLNL